MPGVLPRYKVGSVLAGEYLEDETVRTEKDKEAHTSPKTSNDTTTAKVNILPVKEED